MHRTTMGTLAVVTLLTGCATEVDGRANEPEPDLPPPTVTVTQRVEVPGPTRTVTPRPAPPPAPEPAAGIPGDGTFEVGPDVEPGTYRNDGSTVDGAPCVAYTSVQPNDLGSYIAGSTIEGPGVVVLNRGEWFTTQFCQRWRLQ